MLIAVRHGITSFNDNGGKGGGAEKFRGWLPVPLTLEGMKQAEETADDLADLEDVRVLYCSDVVRTVQSATEIGERLLLEIEPVMELRDWNLGVYVGKPVQDVLKEVLAHIDTPDKVVKEGESYSTFLKRAVPFLSQLVESDDVCIAVTHARVLGLLKALSLNQGKYPDLKTLKSKAPIGPAGIMILSSDWKILYMTKKEEGA